MRADGKPESPAPPAAGLGMATWVTILASALLLSALWGFVAWLKWGADVRREPYDLLVYSALAAVTTVVAVPGLLLHVRKLRALTTRGAVTQGRVEHVSPFTKHGMSPVTIAYLVNGREYRVRRDLPRKHFAAGGTATVLYDPLKPARFTILF
jgi:hypothetical protein